VTPEIDLQYTPGPWHWVDPETDEPTDLVGEAELSQVSLRTTYHNVACKWGGPPLPHFITDTEDLIRTADARLIAKAPEMYEMLERVVRDSKAPALKAEINSLLNEASAYL